MNFARKFSRGPQVQERALLVLRIYLWKKYTQKVAASSPEKLPQLYLVVQGRAQLEHSSHIVKVLVKATCYHFKPWCILKEMTKPAGPFGTMPQESWHPGRVLNWLALSNSTAGKCTPMQVIKQLEHGRTSTTKKQNWSSFQTKYD